MVLATAKLALVQRLQLLLAETVRLLSEPGMSMGLSVG